MEVKGMMDKVGLQKGSYFIGKKCQKFLRFSQPAQNTVSIVPIIGEHKGLSEIQVNEIDRNIIYTLVF